MIQPMHPFTRLSWPVGPACRHLLLLAAALLLNACTTLLPQAESVRLFILTPQILPSPEAVAGTREPLWAALSLRVEGTSRFDTDRLLMLDHNRESLSYRGARWATPLPELVGESWIGSLERSGIAAITYDQAAKQSVRPALVIHLREFQAELGTAGEAVCRVAAVLEFLPSDATPARYLTVHAEQGVDVGDAGQIASGFDQAHAEILRQGVVWLRGLH